jgi:hypothetical protein
MRRSVTVRAAWIGFAGLILAALIGGLFVLLKSDPSRDQSTIIGDKNVVSQGQTGGVTAGTYQQITQYVFEKSSSSIQDATIELKEMLFLNREEGGEYHSRLHLGLSYQIPPANIYVAVHGDGVKKVELSPMRPGMAMTGLSDKREGYAFTNLQTPYPDLQLDIFAAKKIIFERGKSYVEYNLR